MTPTMSQVVHAGSRANVGSAGYGRELQHVRTSIFFTLDL